MEGDGDILVEPSSTVRLRAGGRGDAPRWRRREYNPTSVRVPAQVLVVVLLRVYISINIFPLAHISRAPRRHN